MNGGVHIFWDLSRGAGIAAILFASLSVLTGVLASRDKPVKLKRLLEKKIIHESLALATIVLILAHGLLLLGDNWLSPGLQGIAVPFYINYRPVWVALGIISAYGFILLGLTYYLRTYLGVTRWRNTHRFIVVFWILALFHTFGSGSDCSDSGDLWLQVLAASISLPAFVLWIALIFKRKS